MRHSPLLAFTAPCMILLATCGCTTTRESRAAAQAAHDSLDRYIQDRRVAIDNLNATYRTMYATLLSQHVDATRVLFRLERRADARATADAMLLDWQKATTFTAITESLSATRARQLASMKERAEVVGVARLRYASAYADLDFELGKLKTAQNHMADLAQEEDVRERTAQFLTKIAEIYRKSRAQEDASTP